MRKLTFKIIVFVLSLFFFSCEKDLMTFEGTEGVYFAVQWGPDHGDSTVWAYQNHTPVEFIHIIGDEKLVKLRVMATGAPKDYDREFGLKLNVDSTNAVAGIDYESLESIYTIPAGKVYVDIPVVINRTTDIQDVKKIIGLNLLPSADFKLSVPTWYPVKPHWATSGNPVFDATYHRIEISDFLTRPTVWFGQANNGVEGGLLGAFTDKKFRLICELNDLVYEDFSNSTSMPIARVQVINQVMKTYLQNEYDAGRPVFENDGRLMWVMNVSWTSVEGVPYKP